MGVKSGPVHVLHQSPVSFVFLLRHAGSPLEGVLMRTVLRRVEVRYYRFTPDECLVLHEMQRWATPEDRANAGFEMLEDGDEASDTEDSNVIDWE